MTPTGEGVITMKVHASSRYVMTEWHEQVLEDEYMQWLTRARVVKHLKGDLQGTSVGGYLLITVGTDNLIHAGFEKFSGTVHGRPGSFIAQAAAGHVTQRAGLTVVEGSATHELRGLRGDAELVTMSTGESLYVLDYELP